MVWPHRSHGLQRGVEGGQEAEGSLLFLCLPHRFSEEQGPSAHHWLPRSPIPAAGVPVPAVPGFLRAQKAAVTSRVAWGRAHPESTSSSLGSLYA